MRNLKVQTEQFARLAFSSKSMLSLIVICVPSSEQAVSAILHVADTAHGHPMSERRGLSSRPRVNHRGHGTSKGPEIVWCLPAAARTRVKPCGELLILSLVPYLPT